MGQQLFSVEIPSMNEQVFFLFTVGVR